MAKYLSGKELEQRLIRRINGYADDVRVLYDDAYGKIIAIVKDTELEDGKPFTFEAYKYNERVTPIFRHLYSSVYQVIREGVRKEWLFANANNDELVKSVFGDGSISDHHFQRLFLRNKEAMDAFFRRKSPYGGMNLSNKVWEYVGQLKSELQNTIDLALGEGIAANRLATQIQQYLREPDRWYRRFRIKKGVDKDGNPIYGRIWKRRRVVDGVTQWVNADPKDYHPGRGVYRSSYRNAQRLARTETNIAYRSADFERYQQFDFVVGVEIKLSNNHPITDICDDLQGKYPKGFKWTGWHPNCRCYMVPVLASQDEVEGMLSRIMDGDDTPLTGSVNNVGEIPDVFNRWLAENNDRYIEAKQRGTLPYFIKDNFIEKGGVFTFKGAKPLAKG
jgi:hypothetical protein